MMTLEVLSSIKGAESSEAVNELFEIIKNAVPLNDGSNLLNSNVDNAVSLDALREDLPRKSPDVEVALIKENFPKEKNGFLVVSKVIED